MILSVWKCSAGAAHWSGCCLSQASSFVHSASCLVESCIVVGNGAPLELDLDEVETPGEIFEQQRALARRQSILDDLREDCFSEELLALSLADGTTKLRPIDDFSRSGCNRATTVTEKLKYDSLDILIEALEQAHAKIGHVLHIWTVDIDSAFRRIPILPEHRQYAWVALRAQGMNIAYQHVTMPFGSVSSVHNWDRQGALLRAAARRLLHIQCLKWVSVTSMCTPIQSLTHSQGSWTIFIPWTGAAKRITRCIASKGWCVASWDRARCRTASPSVACPRPSLGYLSK